MTKRERQIAKLDREIREIEGDFRERIDFACNVAEANFAIRAERRGAKAHRHGWPDFLVEENGRTFAVEVKRCDDVIRPAQRHMFAVLSRVGIPVYVWDPDVPEVLTPWAKYEEARRLRRVRARLFPEKARAAGGASSPEGRSA